MAGRDIAATTPASAVGRKTLPEPTTPTSTPTTNTSAWVINSSLWKRRQLRPIYQPPPSYARSSLPASTTTKATHLNNSLISSWEVANNSTDIPKYVTAEPADNPWFKQDKLNQFKANCTPPPPPPPPQHEKNQHLEEETTSFAADCSSQDPALPPPLPTSPLPSKKISKSKFQV